MLVSVGQDWQIERLLQERVPFKSKLRNEARRWCQKGKSRWTVFFFLRLMAIFAIFKKTVAISAISANSVAIFGVFPLLKLRPVLNTLPILSMIQFMNFMRVLSSTWVDCSYENTNMVCMSLTNEFCALFCQREREEILLVVSGEWKN